MHWRVGTEGVSREKLREEKGENVFGMSNKLINIFILEREMIF